MKKRILIAIIVLMTLFSFNVFSNNKLKNVTVSSKEYLTGASDAGFESEELYRCVLDTLGKDRTSATDEELSAITEVICRSQNITSTKGIEKLTSLRYLNLYDNKVSSMDLSSNPNLVMLNMTFNNLKSIDLSHNTNLQQLYLNGNEISSIDLSNNSKLIDLNIYNNELNSINVSNLANLKFLLLSLNNLKTIDLSNNTKLEHVYLSGNGLNSIILPITAENLSRLDLNSNKLTNIDLSKLTKLNYLILSANNISNLDVSKNTNLEYLYASSNKLNNINLLSNVKLIDLDLYNNNLSRIDVSKLSALRYINVSLNKLNDLDLSGISNLNKIYASSNNLSNLSLSNQNNLTEINAIFNNFDGYNISNKSKINYMVIEDDWLSSINLSSYSGLKNLDINNHKIIPVYGNSIEISQVIKNTPSNVTLNKYVLYKDFNSINSNSTSICKYDVEYTVDGTNPTTETTTINTCTDNSYNTNVINGELGKYSRIQIFSENIKLNNVTTTAALKYNGYYEIRFMTLTSNKYSIDNENNSINVEADSDEEIIKNVKMSWNDAQIKISNNKLQIFYNNELLKEYNLERITNPKTGSLSIYITIIFGIISLFVIGYVYKNKRVKI